MIIRFAGFGGQGIVLSSYILGEAAVMEGLQAIQNQAYGSESRGGECTGDVIIYTTIHELEPTNYDVLVALTQPAYKKFLPRLRPSGTLVVERDLVREDPKLEPPGIVKYSLPATELALELFDRRIVANMLVLGYLNTRLKIVPAPALEGAVARNVPADTVELNLKALAKGVDLALEARRTGASRTP